MFFFIVLAPRAGVQTSCPFPYKVLELVSKLVVHSSISFLVSDIMGGREGGSPRIEAVARESCFESGFSIFEANSRLFTEKNREIWPKSAFPQ